MATKSVLADFQPCTLATGTGTSPSSSLTWRLDDNHDDDNVDDDNDDDDNDYDDNHDDDNDDVNGDMVMLIVISSLALARGRYHQVL